MLPENNLPPPRLLRLREVKERTGMGTSTIYLKMSRGEFPPPVKIGNQSRAGAVAWLEAEINTYIAKLISERDACNGWQSLGSAAARAVEKARKEETVVGGRSRDGRHVQSAVVGFGIGEPKGDA